MSIKIAMLGDIVGEAGVRAVEQLAPEVRRRWALDLLIANAENAANGAGLTPALYRRLCEAGVDAFTLGDHAFRKGQIIPVLQNEPNIIRPVNLPNSAKGRGWMRVPIPGRATDLYLVTVLGRLFMNSVQADDPFAAIEAVLRQLPGPNPIVVVEIHAEATSEKVALGWYFNGRATLVAGTHTHVATADARILPAPADADHVPEEPPEANYQEGSAIQTSRTPGTAYITDLGMCGPQTSVLGRRVDRVLQFMTTAMPAPFDPATADPRVCGVVVEINERTGLATSIERIELCAERRPD